MSQPLGNKLVSQLRFQVNKKKNLKAGGPQARHERLKKIVTGLFKYERLELNYSEGDEARGYAERLLSDAIRHGDRHIPTMEMASYWITEKPIIHKLYKVLAPRYQNYETISYTKMWRAPRELPGHGRGKCVLELRNNIYPPLGPDQRNYKNLIHNVLLKEAKVFFEKKKLKEAEILFENKLRKTATKTADTSTNAELNTQAAVSESLETQEKVNSEETGNESSSSETVKDSDESQNGSSNLESSESLGIDKMKIKDEELPDKEK